MAEQKNLWLQLLQYPILILSIILGMALISFLFQIDFSRLSKVGPEGIEFYEERERDISSVFAELETRTNELAAKVEFLESRLAKADRDALRRQEIEHFEATQTTSIKTAQLSRSVTANRALLLTGQQGYIWIGDWGKVLKKWQRLKIVQPEGEKVGLSPDEILPGMQFRITGNMVLRDGRPEDDAAY